MPPTPIGEQSQNLNQQQKYIGGYRAYGAIDPKEPNIARIECIVHGKEREKHQSTKSLGKMIDEKIHVALHSKHKQLMLSENSYLIPEFLDVIRRPT